MPWKIRRAMESCDYMPKFLSLYHLVSSMPHYNFCNVDFFSSAIIVSDAFFNA